uniref:Reverse transcriptase domain-containing protein n=1 Tax=Macrostomum lignano TaxID=282301 RepID=A0A1I8FQ72_9PLAT
ASYRSYRMLRSSVSTGICTSERQVSSLYGGGFCRAWCALKCCFIIADRPTVLSSSSSRWLDLETRCPAAKASVSAHCSPLWLASFQKLFMAPDQARTSATAVSCRARPTIRVCCQKEPFIPLMMPKPRRVNLYNRQLVQALAICQSLIAGLPSRRHPQRSACRLFQLPKPFADELVKRIIARKIILQAPASASSTAFGLGGGLVSGSGG